MTQYKDQVAVVRFIPVRVHCSCISPTGGAMSNVFVELSWSTRRSWRCIDVAFASSEDEPCTEHHTTNIVQHLAHNTTQVLFSVKFTATSRYLSPGTTHPSIYKVLLQDSVSVAYFATTYLNFFIRNLRWHLHCKGSYYLVCMSAGDFFVCRMFLRQTNFLS